MPISLTLTGIQLGTPGYEIALLYLACLTALVLGGTGALRFTCYSPTAQHGTKREGETPVATAGPSGFCYTAKLAQLSVQYPANSSVLMSSSLTLDARSIFRISVTIPGGPADST